MDILAEKEVLKDLETELFIGKIRHYIKVDSTQDVAINFAKEGADEGTLVIAEEQTKGRGRLNRVWESPKGLGIWASIILKPRIYPNQTWKITKFMAERIADVIYKKTSLIPEIKWPNDILIKGKKICGILAEANTKSPQSFVDFLVFGFGINVNQSPEDIPKYLKNSATSLYIETGKKYNRAELLGEFLKLIETKYKLQLK